MTQFSALLIAGPTASGKSALAISCAQKHNGVVINADSMQVYRDLQILSARPTAQEAAAVPHLLFGHVDASVNYSVGKWLEDAAVQRLGLEWAVIALRIGAEVAGVIEYLRGFVAHRGLRQHLLDVAQAVAPLIETVARDW